MPLYIRKAYREGRQYAKDDLRLKNLTKKKHWSNEEFNEIVKTAKRCVRQKRKLKCYNFLEKIAYQISYDLS